MKKEQHAAVLLGILTFEQSKELFQWMDYADKKRLIEAIVRLPYVEKEDTLHVVSECLQLITGEEVVSDHSYKDQLRTLANRKPRTLARYITSLVRKTDNFYIG